MIDKETFLKPRLPEADVDVPDVGTVRVRGLSRQEALSLQSLGDDVSAMERAVLALGVVVPVLSSDDWDAYYAAAPAGEVAPIVAAIHRLSGLQEGSAKAAYKSDGVVSGA